jgi:hypothetical protein
MKMKTKQRARFIGGIGIAVIVISLLAKALYCMQASAHEQVDMMILLGLVIGFSLLQSGAMLEMRAKIEALEKKR